MGTVREKANFILFLVWKMSDSHTKISKVKLSPSMDALVQKSKALYKEKLAYFCQTHKPPAVIAAAPGRVNLIGEHTDYNNGYVLPMALDRSTVVYGTGFVHTGKGSGATTIRLRMVTSANEGDKELGDVVEERKLAFGTMKPPPPPDADSPPSARSWTNYVVGVVVQYMPDLPAEGCALDLAMAFASDVPVGAGLSSSASIEVATATFLEHFLRDFAFSSAEEPNTPREVERAIRCQRAENEWAHSPCGVMDQIASSAAQKGSFMLVDCQSLEITQVPWKENVDQPVVLITDSKITHSISADNEYGKRRRECNEALDAMQQVPLYHVLSLRDATVQDCKDAEEKMGDPTIYKRAMHVVSENKRTLECKTALKIGIWERVGDLLNAGHASLRDDFEVSCPEVDFLVDVAQKQEGVFGSRMTGGGFGGCTVTLVKKDKVDEVIAALKAGYKETHNKDCECFTTVPSEGARVLGIDMDCKQESDFYK